VIRQLADVRVPHHDAPGDPGKRLGVTRGGAPC
jgi:hypothetical protein